MSAYPAMPVFTDALLADCGHLSHAEFGLYMRLLFLMWRSPDGQIPNDPTWVARKLSTSWDEVRPLVDEFCATDGNWITQKRLQKEFGYVSSKSKSNSVSAKIRWNKEKILCERNAPTPTPTPTISPLPPLGESPELLAFWSVYPKQRAGSKESADKALRKALKRATLEEIINGAKKYAASDEVARGFAKGAAAWLNDDRWTSNYQPAAKTNGKVYERWQHKPGAI